MNDDTTVDALLIRYCRQIVLKAMDRVRGAMRGTDRLSFSEVVDNPFTVKSGLNRTKAVDLEVEELMIAALRSKLSKIEGFGPFVIFSEERGILGVPGSADERSARWIVFLDPIDGTEFVETLQGGWTLLAVYDREREEVSAAVAGDIFLDRLYWAGRAGDAEGLDFVTHSWFKLDGGPSSKTEIAGARLNVLTTKVSRFLSVARQTKLLKALEAGDGRVSLAWGSNLIIQVAAGYADVGLEFTKGFATYDVLPGLFIAERAGLTVLDLDGNPVTSRLDIDAIFSAYRRDSQKPERTKFVVAKEPQLARRVLDLLNHSA